MLLPRWFVKSLITELKVRPVLTPSLEIAATSNYLINITTTRVSIYLTAANGLVPFVTFFSGQANCVTSQTTAAEGTKLRYCTDSPNTKKISIVI